MSDFCVGDVVSFLYPRHNFHGVLSKLEPRKLKIDSVRDLRDQPIERITFEIQPLLQRGRLLVTGTDLDKNEERSFYVKSMRRIQCVTKSVTNSAPNDQS